MKKKPKPKHRNYRNAAPAAAAVARAPRPPRPRAAAGASETTGSRILYTAAGAAGTALVGSFLAKEGWAPKTIAGLLTAAGGVAAATSHDPMVRDVGAGAMSAAGGQLALMMFDGNHRQADASELPPGALESAFERARARLAVAADDGRRYLDAAA